MKYHFYGMKNRMVPYSKERDAFHPKELWQKEFAKAQNCVKTQHKWWSQIIKLRRREVWTKFYRKVYAEDYARIMKEIDADPEKWRKEHLVEYKHEDIDEHYIPEIGDNLPFVY